MKYIAQWGFVNKYGQRVQKGDEMKLKDQVYAGQLEAKGLIKPLNKIEQAPENKALDVSKVETKAAEPEPADDKKKPAAKK